MRIRLLTIAAVVCLAPLASQGQEKIDNPYKNAKVGDYVTYKLKTVAAGKDIELSLKQTVSEKSDTEVTVKTAVIFMGNELPGQAAKIDLTKPFDITGGLLQGKNKGKVEKTGEGKQKVTVGDKSYDCNWITAKVVADAKGMKVESDVKVWFSKTVPLAGVVKMEMKSSVANVQMEISGSGSAK